MVGVLDVGDAVATDLLSAIAPVSRCRRGACDEREPSAGYRLRYAAVVERGPASADVFPDGEERDEYDDRAVASQWVGRDRPLVGSSAGKRLSR